MQTIQVVISLLSIGRLFTSVGKLETDSITKEYTGSDTQIVISDEEIMDFVKTLKASSIDDYLIKTQFYVRSSMGPSGPAMASVLQEAKSLPRDLVDSITKVSNPKLVEMLKYIRSDNTRNDPDLGEHGETIRRITVVEDKENKSRVIAIFDY